ncbi:MAG: hypothetical protein ABH854_04975 [Candidatus Diapherotrites archaeon]|nr:hypothetical protein [Candidatus Micrarchaeota archaeon]
MVNAKYAIFTGLIFAVLLSGCPLDGGNGGSGGGGSGEVLFAGVSGATVPAECAGDKDDVCALFECMVDLCWCEDAPGGGVYMQGKGAVTSEQGAMDAVSEYMKTKAYRLTPVRAVKLNSVFYNVFTEDKDVGENSFTVAADGTVMKTQCGV